MNTKKRVTVLCKLVIFLVVTGISEIFTVRPPNWRSDDKQEEQAKNDYYEASDSFFKLVMFWAGIRFSENFTLTDLKFHFDDKPHKTYMKTMIPWHMTEFWKSAIFWVVMALSDNFTVRVSKCRSNGKHHKFSWKRLFRGVWQCFINCPSFGPQLGSARIFNVRAAKCRSDTKHQESRQKRRFMEV